MRKSVFISLLFLPLVGQAATTPMLSEEPSWQRYYEEAGVKGVFLLCDADASHCYTNDKARAETPFIPASTYKIPNLLIALETGVIKDPDQIFRWNGEPRRLKQWENDFTLRGAVQNSVVPIFQQFARDIGERRMSSYLHKFHYGNEAVEGGIDHFWLDGALRISATQQVQFLQRLNLGQLPASKINQLRVKDILISDATPDYVIHGKTGYSLGAPGYGDRNAPGVAWWVGWIEKGTATWYFAGNIDVARDTDVAARKSIPLKILQGRGILP
nr:ClassD_beta_lactamase [uncultured bacterium]